MLCLATCTSDMELSSKARVGSGEQEFYIYYSMNANFLFCYGNMIISMFCLYIVS